MNLLNLANENIKQNFTHKKRWLSLFLLTMIYKLLLDFSYIKILGNNVEPFPLNMNIKKLIIGTLAVIFIFMFINQFARKTSHILYNLYFYIGIIPIATVYSAANKSTIYFISVILGSFLCLLLINFNKEHTSKKIGIVCESKYIITLLSLTIVITIGMIFMWFLGIPKLDALDFDNVYTIRLHGKSIENKLFNYVFSWCTTVILPFLISIGLSYKKYFGVMLLVGLDFIFYLYTANKTIFFSIIIIILMFYIVRFKYANYIMGVTFNVGMISIILLALNGIYTPYSYFVRRVMILPAYLKFLYYDFFSTRPKIGLAGTLWGSTLGKEFPYSEGIGMTISKHFFNNDVMNSNTGFLAEGYFRFGIIGVLFSCIILGVVLKLVDYLKDRTSFVFATTLSAYPIYTLNDKYLIDSLIFGPMLIFVLIILFYSDLKMEGISHEPRIKIQSY